MTKPPTTYEQQVELLKARNIIINDNGFCLKALENLNYYRLTAYMLQYKRDDSGYENVSFETVYNIYEFDRKLRSLLLMVLEEVELALRTKLSYYHAHSFGALGYVDKGNFNDKHNHDEFLQEFSKLINKNRNFPFVKHHIAKKEGKFPIWVAVELFPFGMLSRFFADMPSKNKKEFASEYFDTGYQLLESWLLCISNLRNRCAHYVRLYNFKFNKWPASPKKGIKLKNTIFDYIYILRYCHSDLNKWKNSFLVDLRALVDEYKEYIDLVCIGFPGDWEHKLRK